MEEVAEGSHHSLTATGSGHCLPEPLLTSHMFQVKVRYRPDGQTDRRNQPLTETNACLFIYQLNFTPIARLAVLLNYLSVL